MAYISLEEFWQLQEASEARYEWVNGEVIEIPDPEPYHWWALERLRASITLYTAAHQLELGSHGETITLKTACGNRRKPDLVLMSYQEVVAMMTRTPPEVWSTELVVEVNSPNSKSVDWGEKKEEYEATGIKEYWIVNPELPSLTVHKLVDGKYRDKSYFKGLDTIESQVLPGIQVDPASFILPTL